MKDVNKMKLEFPVEQTINMRYSVRTYDEKPISKEDKEKLMTYANTLSNPFGVPVTFRLLEKDGEISSEKLGTYGMIKGTNSYIGVTVPIGKLGLEAVGYDFEQLILYATHLGIGTCWLGGTFNRSGFATAMGVKENEWFPAISPIGYPAAKKRLTESLFRKTMKLNQRKEWETLFFKNDFTTPLAKEDAGEYAVPLEMLRLAPSASNKQPWRVVLSDNSYHFYEEQAPGYSKLASMDIQRVDIGIGACHFHIAALEKHLSGKFEVLTMPTIDIPKNTQYIFSWIPEKNNKN